MKTLFSRFRRGALWAWWWLRQCSGDAAYENYLARFAARGGHGECCGRESPLSREQFWIEALQRRYAKINRCC